MSEREELAREVFLADNWRQAAPMALEVWGDLVVEQGTTTYAHHIAEHLLITGFRKPRTISTYEELAALFAADVNAVVMDEDGAVLQNLAGGWKSPGSDMFMHSDLAFHVYGPTFTVLHEGSQP